MQIQIHWYSLAHNRPQVPDRRAPSTPPSILVQKEASKQSQEGEMAESNSYEEQRRRQIEENRRKVEELRLHHLSAAVREAAARPKPNPKPKPKAPPPGELRRSGRVASLPEQPNYLAGAKRLENTHPRRGRGSRIEKAMAESNSYEEQRRRQMEENRRKLEELRLHHLSAAVREAAARPKPNPKPRPKRKAPGPGELRRSGRVAGLPEQPNYLKGAPQRDYQRAAAVAAAKQKAEELQRRIHGIRWPAFVKPVTHDCASRAAVMTIPKHFIEYLPAHDEAVVLVDEADDEFHMLYNARHHFLRKGWRGFAAHHDLADGDCLVFQLTERTKFKVYVIRASSGYGNDKTSDDEDEH
ncbi:B3 domain-containing protein Os06g0194400-like isoform X2 [Triticum urartu]|uniref:B3 domain-containing protein Os06g0194400-like isoform X2 n=1 Tax=Triticum urartu TaxID=4572 RepID=UPI0020433663|nr:B3 domain-containing protein Os06g0194400-like isoform X2 [Triticum urartu]